MFLLVSVRFKSKSGFGFKWPFPLFTIMMFAEMLIDIADFLTLLPLNRVTASGADGSGMPAAPVKTMKFTSRCIYAALRESMSITEPWELIMVDTEDFYMRVTAV